MTKLEIFLIIVLGIVYLCLISNWLGYRLCKNRVMRLIDKRQKHNHELYIQRKWGDQINTEDFGRYLEDSYMKSYINSEL